jgi:hypothetical protein
MGVTKMVNIKELFGKNAFFNANGESLVALHPERGSITFSQPENIPAEFVSANVWRFSGQVEFKFYSNSYRGITKILPGTTVYEMRWVYGNRVPIPELLKTKGLVAFLVTSNGGGERFEIWEVE